MIESFYFELFQILNKEREGCSLGLYLQEER